MGSYLRTNPAAEKEGGSGSWLFWVGVMIWAVGWAGNVSESRHLLRNAFLSRGKERYDEELSVLRGLLKLTGLFLSLCDTSARRDSTLPPSSSTSRLVLFLLRLVKEGQHQLGLNQHSLLRSIETSSNVLRPPRRSIQMGFVSSFHSLGSSLLSLVSADSLPVHPFTASPTTFPNSSNGPASPSPAPPPCFSPPRPRSRTAFSSNLPSARPCSEGTGCLRLRGCSWSTR